MKRIYITGGIGSGKSTATTFFKENNFKILSADIISHKILKRHINTIKKNFSLKENEFEDLKKELSNKIFSINKEKIKLEEFMLPKILEEIEIQSEKLESNKINFVIEAPTYFESRKEKGRNDIVILITAPRDIKIERIKNRNPHLSIKDIHKRIDSQMDDSQKAKLSDYTIQNIDIEKLKEEIKKLSEELII